jgi:SDR family mycofactocin-dependent oxidoreductase
MNQRPRGDVEGKVVLVTGAARGQGRAHAVAFAREGADVVALDICAQIPSVTYPMATPQDLDETARLVEALDRRCVAIQADVRDPDQMRAAVRRGIAELGRIDIVSVVHGILIMGDPAATTPEGWQDTHDVNVTGVFNAIQPVVPHMIEQGGGAIVITASDAGILSYHQQTAYMSSKHAAVGLMRSLAADLGQHWIRVNAICPGAVRTPMIDNDAMISLVTGGASADFDDVVFPLRAMALLPEAYMPPEAVAEAAVFLGSDRAKYITGVALPVDLGTHNLPPGVPLPGWTRIAELEQAARAR